MHDIDKDTLARLLKEAEIAHAEYQKSTNTTDNDWPAWYAAYIMKKLTK